MKEYDDNLINNEEIENNINNLAVDERDELINSIISSKVNNIIFLPYLDELSQLNKDMQRLMTPTEDGWKEVDEETRNVLLQEYSKTAKVMEEFIKESEGMDDPDIKDARDVSLKLSQILSKDMRVLRRYNPQEETKTLPDIMADSRTETLDLSNKTFKTVGGNNSSRIPMKILGDNGKVISGYFTMAKYNQPAEEAKKLFDDLAKKVSNPEGAEMVRSFVDKYKEHYHLENKTDDYIIYSMIRGMREVDPVTGDDVVSFNKFIAEAAKINGLEVADVRKKIGTKIKGDLEKQVSKLYIGVAQNNTTEIPTGSRIDSRNTAVSVMAELLGMPNLVCHARSVRVKTQDGKEIEGTFMEESTYLDPNKPGALGRQVDSASIDNSDKVIFKQLADLQVLDYLCGNTDRNGGNMFFEVDEDGIIRGVQGIDNDMSFGKITKMRGNNNKMVNPDSFGFMDAETANRVMRLKPEELEFALRGLVEEDAITAAKGRLKILQGKILESRKNLDPNDKSLDYSEYIKEYTMEDFEKLTVGQLRYRNNIFGDAFETVEMIGDLARDPDRTRKPIETEIGTTNRATISGLKNQLRQINHYKQALKKRTAKGRSSDNYRDIQTAVDNHKALIEKILKRINDSKKLVSNGDTSPEAVYGQFVSNSDLIKLNESMKSVKGAATKYSNGKKKDLKLEDPKNAKKPSDYTKARMDISDDLQKFADTCIKNTKEEEKSLQDNTRRATDQMVKLAKKNENKEIVIENKKPVHTMKK